MISTTGSSIESYLEWARKELTKKVYGKVSLTFVVTAGQVTDVEKVSMDNEHTPLRKGG